MGIELLNIATTSQVTNSSDNINEMNKMVHSIQQVKQQMQVDPSYQPTFQEKTILNAIEEVNSKLAGKGVEVEVSFHEKTKEMLVKVVNTESKEIIREIPSEKLIDMIVSFCEMAGLYVDEKR
ncbi:flagellar protein FlaG [Niameybacter massiliensis]|uniref:flagellar protein FlaG n=1 Tax=Niameybacter massiliensis TaxID=1658108 RepID=UPI0006B6578A|nr:flagellar protein FlaG [Niameybacter massiliensis]